MTGGPSVPEPYEIGASKRRVIGIDLGDRRIGVSVSDSLRVLASPHSVIVRSGELSADHRAIAAVVSEFDAGLVVVGLPLSLSGDKGPAARAAVDEAGVLRGVLDVPLLLHDERLTTVEAERRRHLPADLVRARGRERGRPRARQGRSKLGGAGHVGIDALAATILLQSWLDQKRGES